MSNHEKPRLLLTFTLVRHRHQQLGRIVPEVRQQRLVHRQRARPRPAFHANSHVLAVPRDDRLTPDDAADEL